MALGECLRVLRQWILAPACAARSPFVGQRKSEKKFHCGTAFFSSNYNPRSATNLTCWSFSLISAHAGSGEVNGYFAMQPEAEDSPFTTRVTFSNVLADQIIADAGGSKGMVQGKLEGSFQASGKTADPEALSGEGRGFPA